MVKITKINIFAKNPQKGGTPAIEKIVTNKIFVRIFDDPKSLNENKVLVSKLINWNRVKNKIKSAKL